jgi:hypothetical protein
LIVIFNFLTVYWSKIFLETVSYICTLAFYKLAAVRITIVSIIIIVPDTRVGQCLGPEEMGMGGPGPQIWREISRQLQARKEATWSRKKKEG